MVGAKGNLTCSGTFGFPNHPPQNVRGLRPLTIPRFESEYCRTNKKLQIIMFI